ncbi:MAG: bifunctional oligoribonuclease/PAP phosphatase NrnA [Flavobacteriaceae bacterium]|nr:bifunctional oligoribonuclease/PAP phosphatase NrnA [Flavobacteriaceae bacterium]
MNNKEIIDIKELLSTPKKVAIVSHRNPDGDAYGSSLALYHYLLKSQHSVSVVSPNDCPDFLKWLPSQENIVVFENDVTKGTQLLNEAEIIFTLDFNVLHRVGKAMQEVLENAATTYIMIDHHEQPDDYATYMYSDASISSTSQMLYHFFEKLDALNDIDKTIATCLYTGMVTDTGSFKYPSTTSITHKIAASLIDKGIEHTKIHNRLYDTNSFNRLQLLGTALRNLRILEEYKTAYISLSQREMNSFNFKKGDTEGFVNYGLSLKGVVFAAIFIEDQKQGIIKMSLRSKGKFSVNEFARNHFDGGGHENAAGGRSDVTLKDTIAKFLEIVPTYKSELQNSYEE